MAGAIGARPAAAWTQWLYSQLSCRVSARPGTAAAALSFIITTKLGCNRQPNLNIIHYQLSNRG
jgi:hypothetical protein